MDLRERRAASFQRHPWEVARAAFVARLLRDHQLLPGAQTIVDVGSGDAWLAGQLASANPRAEFVCWDRYYTSDDLAELTGDNIRATSERPDGAFDLATALDVIEHVDDDVSFATEIASLVKPGGAVLITVPAYQLLWTRHDVALDHRRRYSPRTLGDLIAASPLEREAGGSFFHSLLVPRGLSALSERLAGSQQRAARDSGVGAWEAPRPITRAVLAALRIDNAISRLAARASVPLPGLSLWALCRTPS